MFPVAIRVPDEVVLTDLQPWIKVQDPLSVHSCIIERDELQRLIYILGEDLFIRTNRLPTVVDQHALRRGQAEPAPGRGTGGVAMPCGLARL